MAQRRGKETEPPRAEEPPGPEGPEGAGRGAIPELVRKAFAAGLSGFFLTEEAIRKALGETLPKDWSDFAIDQSARTRAEFIERLSYEMGRAMEGIDYATVLAQLLEGRTLEVRASIRLRDDESRDRPSDLRVDLRREDPSE